MPDNPGEDVISGNYQYLNFVSLSTIEILIMLLTWRRGIVYLAFFLNRAMSFLYFTNYIFSEIKTVSMVAGGESDDFLAFLGMNSSSPTVT